MWPELVARASDRADWPGRGRDPAFPSPARGDCETAGCGDGLGTRCGGALRRLEGTGEDSRAIDAFLVCCEALGVDGLFGLADRMSRGLDDMLLVMKVNLEVKEIS
jgi:hypothetical protein